MNVYCPPDYICNATPAWFVTAILIGLFVLIIVCLVIVAVLPRDDR